MTDRQRERKREMNGCRQDALTIKMAREHAATPRRNTGGEDDKGKRQEAVQHTRKEQTTGGKSTATALNLAGNSTPALKHTHSQQSPTRDEEEERITATASSSIPRPTGYSHSPAHKAHQASNHPKSNARKQFRIHPRRGDKISSHFTQNGIRCPTQSGHRWCITPARRVTRRANSLSPPLPSCPQKEAPATRTQ
ncbi:hypothetical protein TCDM_12169 [Trypanosoma cruzi Dm28c]|uniref:Uncharacterized protein n=1 Tax=Trypanosoma cruzi Dm28c TaxID=1416333 RepID=V5B7F9_TRYCR|nr:hypothetical protein TCDM_12169 [Trypanosoma cruzi Dm28c]